MGVAPAFMCVSIDCECDKGPGWRTQRPFAFRGVHDGMAARLAPLFAAFRAKATYLLSPEVLLNDSSAECVRRLGRQAELGTHLHPEMIGPFDDLAAPVTAAVQRAYPRQVERQKLANLTTLFRDRMGYEPRSFRAGRFGVGPHSWAALAELGYHVDSSVTPSVDWNHIAPGLSFRDAPTWPHVVLSSPRPGAPDLWEVPISILPSWFARVPGLGRLAQGRWLRPTHGSRRSLIALANEMIVRESHRPVILNVMFHNVEIVPSASPYAQTEAAAADILTRLKALLEWAAGHAIAVVGLSDVPGLLAPPIPQSEPAEIQADPMARGAGA